MLACMGFDLRDCQGTSVPGLCERPGRVSAGAREAGMRAANAAVHGSFERMPDATASATADLRGGAPAPGSVARVRRRHWLIESVAASPAGTVVSLACLDDDHQGEPLEILWEAELGARILDEEAWRSIGRRRGEPAFDPPRHFGSFLNTLRWNCVTATDPRLFQAPFRAGISIEPYQLEPLRKALRLPRVNLFIADDVGLGKTIEAGLVARELLLRRRVREIVIAAPPSMLQQWKDEMEQRFGLVFEILDRDYIRRVREERGFSVNPWATHPRFLVSQRLLIDETYARSLRDWLQSGSEDKPTVIAN